MLNRMLNYVLKWTRLTSSSDCGVSRYRSGFAFIDLVVIAAFCVLITLIVSCSKVEKPTTGNSAATNTENTDLQTDENLATVSYETTSTDKQSWIKFLEEKML
ncbi:MAG: hypothetical protein LBQ50_12515, partial [Planctomycetaceae bacterium]|nr:hypothetical protein [Planctomycetaceae bacterium]